MSRDIFKVISILWQLLRYKLRISYLMPVISSPVVQLKIDSSYGEVQPQLYKF